MATFISWNCRGFMSKSSELKDIINKHHSDCIAVQETYLKTDKHYIRNYKIFSKHHNHDRASGGVAMLAATHIPSIPLTLNTNLQAVAIRIQIQSLVTVCSLYLPPCQHISQTDLNNLICHLPSPFIILGDLNGLVLSGGALIRTLVACKSNSSLQTIIAESRRIQRRSRRTSWRKFVSSITSTISSRQLWTKVKKAAGVSNSNAISVLIHNGQTISSLKGIADSIASTLAHTSSSQNYPSQILNNKTNAEKQKLNFNSRTNFSYNSNFSFLEFQSCLASVHDSSPGPDSITYSMIKHLTPESQNALLHFYNRIWQEQYFPTLWQQAIIIPLLKPGKDPKNPSNYRPIALTCCLCKLLERMINRRLVYYLETNKFLHPFQSGFRKGRSTIDNLLALETDIRLSFLQRKHLVAIFFDIEKAYDRTWRYGILKDLHDLGLRGNLPIFNGNFLKLRKFRVKVESEFSDFYPRGRCSSR
ncbi:putative RNA-directed DNA polymerase from transposon BS [Araneus ventricosus]|uniref:Putative RNA-directed DNA polymerase from transposon BS n=1 Tax=Araneus ventricosus TaxID=182803 RepID=A0A4Y2RKZ3_ARAVE|nr:putative RNA-directed DNA polymerase from transposon BS [Araneus ventricosus]